MHFNLAPFLALTPIVAGMALPAPSTDAQSLSDLASYEIHTLADGATCLEVVLYYDRYFGPGNAGVPGCGTERLNRLYIGSDGNSHVQQACGSPSCHWLDENSGFSYAGMNVCQTTC